MMFEFPFHMAAQRISKILIATVFFAGLFSRSTYASPVGLDILATLGQVQNLLMRIGPILSSVLFVVAGIFYALGQLFPSSKRANLHSAAIDIIIGAVIVAVLSVASTGLALASTHLLSNLTTNSL